MYDDDDVTPYLEGLDQEERRGGTGAPKEAAPSTAPTTGDDAASAPSPPPAAGEQVCINVLVLFRSWQVGLGETDKSIDWLIFETEKIFVIVTLIT